MAHRGIVPRKVPTPGKVIFIAMPTKGAAGEKSASIGRLHEHVYTDLARLHERYPDHTFIAHALIHDVPVSFIEPSGL